MAEWHVTPDYIVNNWTDELLNLMVDKLAGRKEREMAAIEGTASKPAQDNTVSVETLSASSRGMIKVVKTT